MFDKKCDKCKNKIKKDFDFCPFCGNIVSSNLEKEDYGMLGKNDFINESNFPNFNNSIIDKMFSQAMKMLDKQMKTLTEEANRQPLKRIQTDSVNPNLNMQFYINGKKVFPRETEESQNNMIQETSKVNAYKMPKEKLEKFAKLKRFEPASKVRRIGNKIIYELEVPGVKDIEDVLINKLESSIEIKALAKDKSYSKIINVNLPILRYGLDNGNLFLEMQGK